MTAHKYISENEEETHKAAAAFAEFLIPGSVVMLIGKLGTGKTVFVKGAALALGVIEHVTSPTFTLIHEYNGTIPIYHMDLYRINSLQELRDIGIEDYFDSGGICFVEWGEKLGEFVPEDAILVTLKHLGDTHREIVIERP